jgi:N-acetylneuraminic acid mutarotase
MTRLLSLTIAMLPMVEGLLGPPAAAGPTAARTLTLDDHVAAQKAIEQVYWKHRVWPKENRGAKPAFASVMKDAVIRAKVEDGLRETHALRAIWGREITAEEIQSEMDRIAHGTRDAATLRDLFAALHDDPDLISECLIRPLLTDRIARTLYDRDERYGGADRRRVEGVRASLATADSLRLAAGGLYREAAWHHGDVGVPPGAVVLRDEEWIELVRDLGKRFGLASSPPDASVLPAGRVSPLHESEGSFGAMMILNAGKDDIRIASVTWERTSFDAWWARNAPSYPVGASAPIVTGLTTPALSHGECADDTWTPTPQDAPDPRQGHAAVWTGTEMLIWGGVRGGGYSLPLNDGWKYSPTTDTWTRMADGGAPSPRTGFAAVWTGTELLLWGGLDETGHGVGDGGRYDPAADTWQPLSMNGAPTPRFGAQAVWTGTQMIVWGGMDYGPLGGQILFDSGGRYAPSTDSWMPTSLVGAPLARTGHASVWSGTEMIVWGGNRGTFGTNLATGGRYNPVTDSWLPTGTSGAPTARSGALAVWTGSRMLIWGGPAGSTGGRYDPSSNAWTPMATSGSPPPESYAAAVWTGGVMIVWGAAYAPGFTAVGGRYDPATNTWTAVSTINAPAPRGGHTAVWTGSEMIVWGGSALNSGGRYDPASDTWIATSTGTGPVLRMQATAVWTGMEMIVWGGRFDFLQVPGFRYSPSLDTWSPISSIKAPSARFLHWAFWTGTKMIIWGGFSTLEGSFATSGGLYDPATDSWTPTSSANAPPNTAKAVWTGSEMIVWGGYIRPNFLNTGARYNPSTDSWTPTSTKNAPELDGSDGVAVWTGAEMIVWGASSTGAGGRYDPITDSWTPMSTAGEAGLRRSTAAVWTGTEMIVWGGEMTYQPPNTGARYEPRTDSWRSISTVGQPVIRKRPSAVWTGVEMIVWGGGNSPPRNTGGRYNPSSDTWRPTTQQDAPSPRQYQATVWTGTEMIVWGADPLAANNGRYCACTTSATFYPDADGDGFGDCMAPVSGCAGIPPSGFIAASGDCNDTSAAVHPGATETCNTVDDDCNGLVDDDASGEDVDGDGVHGACDSCPTSYNPAQSDLDHDGEGDICDLNDALIYIDSTDKHYREWQAESGYTTWNSYRGSLAALRATGEYTQAPGSNSLAARNCGVIVPYVLDADVPPPGEVAFNLVTGVAGGVESSLGTSSAGVPRPNANPCP